MDQSVSNALSLQASNQAHLSQAILPPNKPNFIAKVDSGIDDELLKEINKDHSVRIPILKCLVLFRKLSIFNRDNR